MNPTLDLSRFQAQGTETCFHDRHIGAQIGKGGLVGRIAQAQGRADLEPQIQRGLMHRRGARPLPPARRAGGL